jgi:hypothetical protein
MRSWQGPRGLLDGLGHSSGGDERTPTVVLRHGVTAGGTPGSASPANRTGAVTVRARVKPGTARVDYAERET